MTRAIWVRPNRLPSALLAGFLVPAVLATGLVGAPASGAEDRDGILIEDPRITEASGLAVSPRADRLLYTVNDSGNDAVVYVVDRNGGDVVGTTGLTGLDPETADPEAMAVDADGTLWVADTGDNEHGRSDTALYALPAPGAADQQLTPRRYPVEYASGRPDVEALLVDQASGAAWLVTKDLVGGQVLRLPRTPTVGAPMVPRPVEVSSVPGLVTDATVLPARPSAAAAAVLRTYGVAHVFRLPGWEPVGEFPLPPQPQGESLTALSGSLLLAGSEGSPARIDQVLVPRPILDRLAAPAADDGREPAAENADSGGGPADPGPADDSNGLRGLLSWVVLAAGGLLAVAVLMLLGRSRRTRR